jgi:protein gp37
MGNTPIQWTDRTWNPVRGCSRISPGCVNCYAEKIAARFSDGTQFYTSDSMPTGIRKAAQPFHLYANRYKSGSKWTGRVDLVEDKLLEPLKWRKPRRLARRNTRVFVNSMSDLFHENLPDWAIDRVFAVMALTPHITYQVLTKRAARMRDYFAAIAHGASDSRHCRVAWAVSSLGIGKIGVYAQWPLPNVWLGVSVEDQQRADERVEHLRATPAAVRFISQEPQLEEIRYKSLDGIHWVIIGGESGPDARPFNIGWARQTIAQCRAAGVAPFVKQLGALIHADPREFRDPRIREAPAMGRWAGYLIALKDRAGGDMAEWPEDLRVREFPGGGR